MAGPESKLIDRIRKALVRAHPTVMVTKIHGSPYQPAGLPDLLCLVPPLGRAVWLEAKAQQVGESAEHARAKTTERQKVMHEKLVASGCAVAVVVSELEAVEFVDGIVELEMHRLSYE